MRRAAKISLWSVSAVILFAILAFAYPRVMLDYNAKPTCHKNLTMCFELRSSSDETKVFPNVDGSSPKTILSLSNELVGMFPEVATNYKYVPGLRSDDPGELIVFYLNQPTRWQVHIKPESILKRKSWLVVPIDYFHMANRSTVARGEFSENLTTEQFTNRLIATLNFVRTNGRPNWQAIVKEHSAFLESLKRP